MENNTLIEFENEIKSIAKANGYDCYIEDRTEVCKEGGYAVYFKPFGVEEYSQVTVFNVNDIIKSVRMFGVNQAAIVYWKITLEGAYGEEPYIDFWK